MIITTTDSVPCRRITKVLGLARGNTVRSRHIGQDLTAAMKNITGGEVRQYTKLMAESREQSIDRMIAEAKSKYADGIVAMRFVTSPVMQGSAELLAYGTAVKLRHKSL